MSALAAFGRLVDFDRLDRLAAGDSALHSLDARAKLIVTLFFIVSAMSFGRHAVAPLLAFCVYPVAIAATARLPARLVWRQAALVLPMALLIGLPNPWLDRDPVMIWGGVAISGGWISLVSIVLRAWLAAAAVLLLVATTGFPAICGALGRLGLPQALVVQLLLLYRYLAVLGDEALRMTTAHELRSGGHALSMRSHGALAGRLLLRTWDRAERIHRAMCARGFDGHFRGGAPAHFGRAECRFVAAWCAVFVLLRVTEPAAWLGSAVIGWWR